MKNYFPEGLESNIQVKNFKKTKQLRVDHLIEGSVSEEFSLKTCMMIFSSLAITSFFDALNGMNDFFSSGHVHDFSFGTNVHVLAGYSFLNPLN